MIAASMKGYLQRAMTIRLINTCIAGNGFGHFIHILPLISLLEIFYPYLPYILNRMAWFSFRIAKTFSKTALISADIFRINIISKSCCSLAYWLMMSLTCVYKTI
jgi:hypothetical protein